MPKRESPFGWTLADDVLDPKDPQDGEAEDPVLAETLSYLQLQQEIPEDVYVAVATVLAWAYWLKGEAPQVLTER